MRLERQYHSDYVEGFRLRDVSRAIANHKFAVIVTFFIVSALTFTIFALVPWKYQASAVLMVGSRASNPEATDTVFTDLADTAASLTKIVKDEEIIRAAVDTVGVERLSSPQRDKSPLEAATEWLDSQLRKNALDREISPFDRLVRTVGQSVVVKTEPNSNIIRIAFSDSSPSVAADVANAVARSFVDHVLASSNAPEADRFYENQVGDLNLQVDQAAEKLKAFAISSGVYSIDTQKEMLLRRVSELSTAQFATRGKIADTVGQIDALTAQLKRLKPVAASGYVASVVDQLGNVTPPTFPHAETPPSSQGPVAGTDTTAPTARARPQPSEPELMQSPPIVMVRVLQDTMAQLFKLNAELEGMEALEKEQSNQLNALWSELKTLAANQAEFQELTRALALASENAAQWSKTAVAEAMSARFDEAKISAIRIVLPAFPPTHSTFPGYPILGLLAILGGIFSGAAVALALEFLFRRPTPKLRSP